MVKTTLKQPGKRFNSVHMASDFYLNIWTRLLKHRATTSAGKPLSILRVIAEKKFALPSVLVVWYLFRLLQDFRTDSP